MKINNHEIKGVIFDVDGTLLDTEYFQWQGWVEALKPHSKSISKTEYLKYAGKQGNLLAAEKLELKPEKCLSFEDTHSGLTSAKAAGLTCFAIPNEFSQGQDFSQADGVFSNLEKAITLLMRVEQ